MLMPQTVARARKGTKRLFCAYQKPSCGLLSALASTAQNIVDQIAHHQLLAVKQETLWATKIYLLVST